MCAWLGRWLLLRAHAPGFEQQIPLQVKQASAHRGGGFPQVVFPQHLDASGHVEVSTPGDRHAEGAAEISLIRIFYLGLVASLSIRRWNPFCAATKSGTRFALA